MTPIAPHALGWETKPRDGPFRIISEQIHFMTPRQQHTSQVERVKSSVNNDGDSLLHGVARFNIASSRSRYVLWPLVTVRCADSFRRRRMSSWASSQRSFSTISSRVRK